MILRLCLNIILISGDICKSRTDPGDIIQTVLAELPTAQPDGHTAHLTLCES